VRELDDVPRPKRDGRIQRHPKRVEEGHKLGDEERSLSFGVARDDRGGGVEGFEPDREIG